MRASRFVRGLSSNALAGGVSGRWDTVLAGLGGLLLVLGAVFAFWPSIDIGVSREFFNGRGFPASHIAALEAARKVTYWFPALLLAVSVAAALIRRQRPGRPASPWPVILFLVSSFAVGPGLIVNVGLKSHSHRPRPVQTNLFGGSDAFKPWYEFDGACRSNCSFASGEVSAAMWTIAPALTAPPEIRVPAMVASLAFTLAVGALRVAFGGHYLSDAALSAVLTLIVVLVLARAFSIGWRTSSGGMTAGTKACASEVPPYSPPDFPAAK